MVSQSKSAKDQITTELAQRTYAIIHNASIEGQLVVVSQLRGIFELRAKFENNGSRVYEYPINQTHYLTQILYQYFVEKNQYLQTQTALTIINKLEKIVNESISLDDISIEFT